LQKGLSPQAEPDILPASEDHSHTNQWSWGARFKEDIMLVLSRKIGESIVIDGDIHITISSVQGGRVKLCIDAPRDRRVVRAEVDDAKQTSVRREVNAKLPVAVPQLAGT
jgi:carbon storage regulator CsrA